MQKLTRFHSILLSIICCICVYGSANASDLIKVNIAESILDKRISFKREVLETALDNTRQAFGDYDIETYNYYMNAKRAFKELISGDVINVHFALTLPKWEEQAIPIRIPVRRGLISYRLLLINEKHLEAYKRVNSIDDLRSLRAGLSDSWTTYEILSRQNFKIVKVGEYEAMFNMLSAERYDYLLRGVNEIYDELDTRNASHHNFVVEPRLAVHIPSATYIFVSKNHPRLAQRLQKGLEAMVENGQLEAIFNKYYAEDIKKADLKNRKILYIENKLQPKLGLEGKELLWTPEL